MPGEIFREVWAIGRETAPGAAALATRKVYVGSPSLTRPQETRQHPVATGTRDNNRSVTLGPVEAGGSVQMSVSADELLEWLLITVAGAVTPTTPTGATNARLWTFKPSNTTDTITIERNDGANLQRGIGYRGNQITIAGSVAGDNTATIELFGQDVIQNWAGPLSTVTDRVPTLLEGWQTRMFLDTFGTAPGVTYIPGALVNWSIVFGGNLSRRYTAANTLAASNINLGTLTINGNITMVADAAQAITELVNASAATQRVMQLEFIGPASGIEAGANEVQTISVTGGPTAGTFTVNAFGSTVGPIAFNSTAAAAQTLFDAVFGTGNTAVTGGPLPTTPLTVTFVGSMAGYDWPTMSLGTNTLTGGTTPTATFATTTPGRSGARFVRVAVPLAWSAPDTNQEDQGSRAYQYGFNYVYDPTNLSAGIQYQLQNARTTAY
jgi:hypothetical protein